MARARNIKPSFFQDDKLGELPIYSRMAFIGLWTLADFKGCLEFRPKMLKVQLLPYDECDIEEAINNLEQARFIRYYANAGKKYIKIVNFEKHQNPHKNEKEAGSEIPDYNINNELTEDGTKTDLIGTTRADSLLLIPSSLIPESRKKPLSEYSDEFLKFWSAYPNKTGKGKARDVWNKKKPPLEAVLKALLWQAESQKWKEGFIPNPETYLNQTRWEDEPQVVEVGQSKKSPPWYITGAGIEEKAIEAGIDTKVSVMAVYKIEVYKHFGITPEMVRKATAEFANAK